MEIDYPLTTKRWRKFARQEAKQIGAEHYCGRHLCVIFTRGPIAGRPEPIEVNRYIVARRDQRSVVLYWYQAHNRVVASEYWGKIYTVIDSVRLRRSDGAMVRVTVPITGSEEKAVQAASELAVLATSALPEFVPN